jgi:hypothetical protein
MTNVWGTPGKADLRTRLFRIGVEAMQKEGWTVERIPRLGKSSVRRIRRGAESRTVSIRTTQDTWIAFPRNETDTGWGTLSDVDAVVAVSVDDREHPKYALVHFIEGDEMRDRFDRAYRARKAAGHSIPLGRGVWVSLYHEEAKEPVNQVGAGAGLKNPSIARVPLHTSPAEASTGGATANIAADAVETTEISSGTGPEPLTIGEAKLRLARSLGVSPSSIKITIEA